MTLQLQMEDFVQLNTYITNKKTVRQISQNCAKTAQT